MERDLPLCARPGRDDRHSPRTGVARPAATADHQYRSPHKALNEPQVGKENDRHWCRQGWASGPIPANKKNNNYKC